MPKKLTARQARRIQRGVVAILEGLGYENWREEQNLKSTPQRVARMFEELAFFDPGHIETLFKAVFPSENSQMIIQRSIYATGVCPHHLMPIRYNVAVAYVPKEKVIGLSKLPRLVEAFCRRLDVQENVTDDIADAIEEKLEPRGVMVVMEGSHGCMTYRGVRQHDTITTTSAVRGVFRDPQEQARGEFLALMRNGGFK